MQKVLLSDVIAALRRELFPKDNGEKMIRGMPAVIDFVSALTMHLVVGQQVDNKLFIELPDEDGRKPILKHVTEGLHILIDADPQIPTDRRHTLEKGLWALEKWGPESIKFSPRKFIPLDPRPPNL